MKKENRGGKRKGSGRKQKYGELTKSIQSFRVPESKAEEVIQLVKDRLAFYEKEYLKSKGEGS